MPLTEVTRELVRGWIPKRRADAHKYDFGKVHIIAGSRSYVGAPLFAAHGAVRAGSGLVCLFVPEDIWPVLAPNCHEVILREIGLDPSGSLEEQLPSDFHKADAALIGPGMGSSIQTASVIRTYIKNVELPLVLDADGINAVVGHIDVLKARGDRLTVLTPHEGEFSRLLGGGKIGGDRASAVQAFARESGCVVVLKGHGTVTAFPDGRLYGNTTGNPGMAKGGSGDVLAGMIVSLIGQGIPPKEAVPAAVWLHGRAGDLCAETLGEYGMTPTDLLGCIPLAFKTL